MFNLRSLALKWRQHLEAEGKAERTVSTFSEAEEAREFVEWQRSLFEEIEDFLES